MSKPVLVLGAGSFGTALAIQLSRVNSNVRLWGRNQFTLEEIELTRKNQHYLPDVQIPENIVCYSDLRVALEGVSDILIAVPSAGFLQVMKTLRDLITIEPLSLISAVKGIDSSLQLQSEIVEAIFPNATFMVLSGPSFAREIAEQLFSALVLSGKNIEELKRVQALFNSESFRVYLNNDLIGTQLGGAVKNIIAIATGITDGLGFGANARAALITRGLAEISRLVLEFGGQQETVMGLSGMGDLILTCTDDKSRNRRFGLSIGEGSSIEKAVKKIGQVVEGIDSAQYIRQLADKYNVHMPITSGIYSILHQDASPQIVARELITKVPGLE